MIDHVWKITTRPKGSGVIYGLKVIAQCAMEAVRLAIAWSELQDQSRRKYDVIKLELEDRAVTREDINATPSVGGSHNQ